MINRKNPSINFIISITKLCWILYYNNDENYPYDNKTQICKFKCLNNIILCQFRLGSKPEDH